MESIEKILSRQCAKIEFENNKVKYFSLSTQHGQADTLEEAIDDIVEADKKYNGKTPLHYMIEKDVNKLYSGVPLLKMPMSKDLEIALEDLRQSFEKWYKDEGWADVFKDIEKLNGNK